MFMFIYRKENNDSNGNPRRFVTMWYLPEMGEEPVIVCQSSNENYIGMWATVQKYINQFAANNPQYNIDPATARATQLPTAYKGG